uniref:Uncharacterized protein n=1 Tax=viral metagenome TaxID=1070528 RepID=A0A6C0BEH8_9ZZZZ
MSQDENSKIKSSIDINSSKYISIILRRSFMSIDDFDFLLTEYKELSGEEYNYDLNDQLMISLVVKHKLNITHFSIINVKSCFLNYVIITKHFSYDDIKINYDRFRLDMIKKVLGSECEKEEILRKIEKISFSKIDDGIIKNIH